MNFDRSFNSDQANALRADLQARADMLDAAERDFTRQKRCMHKLEAALVRWLMDHRLTFGDRFCINALLQRLPLPELTTNDRAEGRLRGRIALSRALRPACIHAISLKRGALHAYRASTTQIATRLHTRAFALAASDDWDGPPLEAACTALDLLLTEDASDPFAMLSVSTTAEPRFA